MTRRVLSLALLAAVAAAPLEAQDRFGAAVRVTDDGQVLVLKPGFGRGPASLVVFERRGGEWVRAEELWSEGTAGRGESFGASLTGVAGGVLVASGDPDVRIGAYGFARDGDGGWAAAADVPLPGAGDGGSGQVTLGTVMAILQPPPRAVAADGDAALVAVAGGQGSPGRVLAFERDAGGAWRAAGSLEVEGLRAASRFGAALAVRGELAAVGAPGQGPSGTVYVFARGAGGAWTRQAALASGDVGAGAALGSSLVFIAPGEIAAGAPRADGSAGRVVHFARGPDGAWVESGVVAPQASGGGQGFGAALAATPGGLWVGAPGADEARGRVDVYARGASPTEWHMTRSFTPPAGTPGVGPGAAFGSALALGGGLALVGAQGAEGTAGLVALYELGDDGSWSSPIWLRGASPAAAVTAREVRCEEGEAAGFGCADVDLQAYLPPSAIGAEPGERVSDAWGWTDPETGREYGLVGRTGGAAILDITDATNPVYLGVIPANRSGARDLKVYRDHLFFTGDGAGAHGLIVFDLTRLRDVSTPPRTFEPDLRWDGIGSAHNLIIDTGAGTAFTVSTSGEGHTCGGGLVMIDIREPLAPGFAGCFTDTEGLLFPGRTHDAQCLVYDGPDADYRGRELCFASNETALRIVDVTDKENPAPISAAAYPGVAYIHQGWLSEDRRYFYLDDELDELVGTAERTRTLVWDVSDLDDPVVVGEYYGPNASTDHNLYIKGDRMYQANYQAGFRVIDISEPENPREVGYFDTTPYGVDPPGFNGAWTAFPYFESETVLVTSMLEGVFLLKPRSTELVP